MGTFCTNFHARSTDTAAVSKALARITSAESIVAEPCNGWTAIFDERAAAQDAKEIVRIARGLSAKLNTAVFSFLVHDSDIFQYRLYDSGKLIDQFDSRPDYFGTVSRAHRRKWAGRPDALLPFAAAGVSSETIAAVLEAPRIFEERRTADFAALFGIDPGLACGDFKDVADLGATYVRIQGKGSSPADRALKDAVRKRDVAAAGVALSQGASPNARDTFQPLLLTAIDDDQPQIVELLVSAGANISATVDGGGDALWKAAALGRTDMAAFLLDRMPSPSRESLANALIGAVMSGSVCIVKLLLRAGADVNAPGAAGLPLVHAVKGRGARATERNEVVALLLDAGADVNARAKDGATALMAAAMANQIDPVRKLLAAAADANIRSDSGLTALTFAIAAGHREVAALLLPLTAAESSPSPATLWAAAASGDLDAVEKALAAGISPNATAGRDLSPLLFAAANNHTAVALRLLEAGADPKVYAATTDSSPLKYSIGHGNVEVVRELIRAGIDVNTTLIGGVPVLNYAVMGKDIAMVKLLLEVGAKPYVGTDITKRPLWLAEHMNAQDIVELLRVAQAC
jgi:ankyrin repeat protein